MIGFPFLLLNYTFLSEGIIIVLSLGLEGVIVEIRIP